MFREIHVLINCHMFIRTDIETQQLIIEIFEALKGQEWTAKDTIQLFQLLMREGTGPVNWVQYI